MSEHKKVLSQNRFEYTENSTKESKTTTLDLQRKIYRGITFKQELEPFASPNTKLF